MIPGRHSSGYQQIGIEGESMSIIMDEKSAHTMSSVIYSDHRKKEAVIRELCTNATDAHIMAGKEAVPIEVTLPTLEFPYLMIKDQGVGISTADGIKYFTSFFASGSQLEEKPTGYYGLGAKSPHAYTDTYEIIMIKDGLKSVMLCFKDEEGIPSYRLLTEDVATDEPNGVSFKVPVMEKDFEGFLKAARYVLPMFDTRPTVFGDSAKAQEALVEILAYKETAVDLGSVKIMLTSKDKAPCALRAHPSYRTLTILMGNILYPVEISTYQKNGLTSSDGYLQQLHRELRISELAMTLSIDIVKHGMRVEPGRERIITNAKNMAIMESVAERVVKTLYAEAKKENQGKTAWQISKQVMSGEGFHSLLKKDPVTYLKYQFLGAGQYVKNTQLNPILDYHDVKATVVRSDATLTKTSSMSSSRFISAKQGEFNPIALKNIVLLDDKRIKISEVSDHLLRMCVAEEGVLLGPGVTTKALGVIIRANSKKGTPKDFADKMFGEGEYMMASELLNRDFDTSAHDEMNKKTVRLVQFSSHYNTWHYNEDFALSPLELKKHGTRAVPRRRIARDVFLTMSEEEFEKRKDEMAFLFRYGRGKTPNILLSKETIKVSNTYPSLDAYVQSNFRYHTFGSTFTGIVARHAISNLLESVLKEMGVTIKENRELNAIHEGIVSIMEKGSALSVVLPDVESPTQKLFLETRSSSLRMGATVNTVINAKHILGKHDLLTKEEINKTLDKFSEGRNALRAAMKEILVLLRSNPLEAQYHFSISTERMKAMEGTLLKGNGFSEQQIIERLKNSVTQHNQQKIA